MEYTFLKKESISFNGIDAKHFNVGDKIEGSSINKVSPTLLDYYLKHEILSIGEVFEILDDKEVEIQENSEEDTEVKSYNPVLDNKAITNLDNKSLEDLSIKELKVILFNKSINFNKRIGKEKLIKILEENK